MNFQIEAMAKIYYNPNEDELIPIENPAPEPHSCWCAEHSEGLNTFLRCVCIILVSAALLAALGGCFYGAFCFIFRWQFWIFFGLALVAIFLYKVAIVKLTDPDCIIYSI